MLHTVMWYLYSFVSDVSGVAEPYPDKYLVDIQPHELLPVLRITLGVTWADGR